MGLYELGPIFLQTPMSTLNGPLLMLMLKVAQYWGFPKNRHTILSDPRDNGQGCLKLGLHQYG